MRLALLHYSSSAATALPSVAFSSSPLLPRRLGLGLGLGFRETPMAAIAKQSEPDPDLLQGAPISPPVKQQEKQREEEDLGKQQLGEPPEKPLPGDCCGSGCVRCVWDMYFEELELYNDRKAALEAGRKPSLSP